MSVNNNQQKHMKAKLTYRQGDVLVEHIDNIPANATKQRRQKIILAYGEKTGHNHAIERDQADWWKTETEQFVTVKNTATITHQEHAPIALPAGNYRVTRQREYAPEAIRNVAD